MKRKYIVKAVSFVMAALLVNPGTPGMVYASEIEGAGAADSRAVGAITEPGEPTEGQVEAAEETQSPEAIEAPVADTEPAEAPAESHEAAELPTDPYGNPIDWDTNASGGEDAAGMETEVDLMDSPTYSPEEQESVAEVIGTKPAKNEETGFVRVTCDLGDDWAGYNIRVQIYDQDFDRYLIYCYAQNNYTALEELPAGHYQVYEAVVPGDQTNAYPMVLSVQEFDLSPNRTFELTVSRIKEAGNGPSIGTGAITSTEGQTGSTEEPAVLPETVASSVVDDVVSVLMVLLIIAVGMGAGIGVAFFIKKRRDNRYQ